MAYKKLVNRKWEVLSSEYLSHEPWHTVRRDYVRLPNGNEIPSWYVMEYPNWINVIARTDKGEFVMISQYRHGIKETHYELVAGVCEADDANPMETAKRELMEETGFGGGSWTEFMVLSPNPTNQNNWSYTYLAEGVKKLDNQHLEASEDIRVYLLTEEDVRTMLQAGEIVQALHAAPLLKYFLNLK